MISSQLLLRALLAVDEDRTSTMGRLFLVALVVLSPWWGRSLWRFVRDRRERSRADRAATRAEAELASSVDPDALSAVISSIESAADAHPQQFDLRIPAVPTVDHRPIDRLVVDAIVTDALHRGGMIIVHEAVDTDGGRRLLCEKVEQPRQ